MDPIMELKSFHRYILSLLSGLFMIISFPHTGSLYLLSFLAWIPLLMIEENATREKLRSGKLFIHAYIVFVAFNAGASYWIYYSIGGEEAAILAYLMNGLLMTFAFLFFHLTKKRFGKIGYLALPIFWIAFEFLHYHWELSWPWMNIGNTFAVAPQLVQWYSYTGILGGTLWILVVNILIAIALGNILFEKQSVKQQSRWFSSASILFALPIAISLWMYNSYSEVQNPLEVVVTQPNVDPYNEKFSADTKEQLDKVLLPAKELITENTAIVLAPETAISYPFNEAKPEASEVFNYVQEQVNGWGNTALLIGAETYRFFDYYTGPASRKTRDPNVFWESYNTSVLMKKDEQPLFLHKSELVLGVEKIPFTKWLPFLEELSIENGGTSGTLGIEDEPKVFTIDQLTFAPVVCYESVYGNFMAAQSQKGAEAIFVITNDGWWSNTAGHKQHASIARLRAVESRKYVVRSANTGISCVINQRGDVLKATKYWVQDAFKTTIQLNNKTTFYDRHIDLIGKLFSFFASILLIVLIVKWVQKRFR